MAGAYLDLDEDELPYLSARCWKCGDAASMPPRSKAVLVTGNYTASRYGSPTGADLYAILHVCTNSQCLGAVVGYYTMGRDTLLPEFHTPAHRSYRVSEAVPARPREMLQAANDSRGAPVACVSAAVRAVEAMLAEIGYRERKDGLMGRIKKAVSAGLLPGVMEEWALEVREIGTDTHTDEDPAPLPDAKEAERALTYANLLADYLFVLPAMIKQHRAKKASAPKAQRG
jgi:hypothetical protein